MAVGGGAHDAHAGLSQGHRQVQRGLAAELQDQALGVFRGHDVEDVLPGQGLEIELVRGVVVGGDRLGVGVDHDGLHPQLPQGEGGLAAAVVELDALADAVGAAAQDGDLGPLGLPGLVLPFVGGIEVRGVGLELGGAGVHQLVDRGDAVLPAQGGNVLLAAAPELPQLHVGEAVFLGPAQRLFELILAPALAQQLAEQRQFIGEGHQVLNLVQEPGVDHGEVIDLVHAHPVPERPGAGRTGAGSWAPGVWSCSSSGPISGRSLPSWPRPKRPISSERMPFCRASLKVRPMAMTSPTDFMAVVRKSSAPGNFSKVQRGILTTQ